MVEIKGSKFAGGKLVWTQGINELVANGLLNFLPLLRRHFSGDWGDLSSEDQRENDYSVDRDLRILSAYETSQGKIWIITEADRSSTCVLLPSEY